MAERKNVSRAVKLTAVISVMNIMFSGGCVSGSGNTRAGGYRDGNLNGVANDYSGENGSGAPGNYQDTTEWNFKSRVDNGSSASRNSTPSVSGGSVSQNKNNGSDTEQQPSTVYQYYNPTDPRADKDGNVTVVLPAKSRLVKVETDGAGEGGNISGSAGLGAGYNDPAYQSADVEAIPGQGQLRTASALQSDPTQPALPPLPDNIRIADLNNGNQTVAVPEVVSQPRIKPVVVTSITVGGQAPDTASYQAGATTVQAINTVQPALRTTVASESAYTQQPTVNYALPRVENNGQTVSGNQIPVIYAGGTPESAASVAAPAYQYSSQSVDDRRAIPQNNAIPARAEYAPALQVPAGINNVDELAVNLERLLQKDPDNLDLQMALRYAYAARGQYDKALEELTMVPIEYQKDSIALVRATILSSQLANNNDPLVANSALSAIRSLQDKVANKADLKISTFKICSKVDNFGQYQEIAKSYLETGNACQILVYCELENYQYKQDEEGKYSTDLHAEITLFDSSLNILQQLSEDVVDTPSYNKRKDFFLRGPFKVPQLKAGKYQIVISMEDKVAGKRALAARYQFEVKGTDVTSAASATTTEIPAATIGQDNLNLLN